MSINEKLPFENVSFLSLLLVVSVSANVSFVVLGDSLSAGYGLSGNPGLN